MSIYDNISSVYEKWSSGDAAYIESGEFYTSALRNLRDGSYLELGIGTGRISLEAIRFAPISITGIDFSSNMLRVCQKNYRALSDRKGILQLCKMDVTHLSFHEQFNGAIMPFRTIGHIMNEHDLQSLFCGVFAALKPGGWFMLDHYMFQKDWAIAHNNMNIIMYKDDDMTIYDRYIYDFDARIMHCNVFVNDVIFESFDFRWLEPIEIERAACRAGFYVQSLLGDFDGSAWTKHSYEQIWLLRKPGNDVKDILFPTTSGLGGV